ncbi:MAG TPA: TetR/AcrR family transcriptional regulator [Candidatus Omnitrophota bacterium]|nr:TetR/AcrR family transcriptional regulator [Candidatus Omnitrophota bacterium]HPS20892.1 TetR/AcrR family transcriptional regulator [Candidatus Omnitrophota bacterium]
MINRKTKTAVRRTQICRAALAAIADHGVKGLTISAIAKRVGMTDSNVYRHFKSKEDIMMALIDDLADHIMKILADAGKKNNDEIGKLEYIFTHHVKFMEERKGIPRVLVSDEVMSTNDNVPRRMKEVLFFYLKNVGEILSSGRKKGMFGKDCESEIGASVFLGLIQAMVLQWFVSGYAFSLEKRSEKIWKIFLKSVSARS